MLLNTAAECLGSSLSWFLSALSRCEWSGFAEQKSAVCGSFKLWVIWCLSVSHLATGQGRKLTHISTVEAKSPAHQGSVQTLGEHILRWHFDILNVWLWRQGGNVHFYETFLLLQWTTTACIMLYVLQEMSHSWSTSVRGHQEGSGAVTPGCGLRVMGFSIAV